MVNQQWLGLGPVTSRPLAPSTDTAWVEDVWNAFFQEEDGSDAWPGWLGDGDSGQVNSLPTTRYRRTDQAHVNTIWSKPPDLFGENDDLLAIRRSPPLAELDVPPPTAWSPGWRSEPVKTAHNSAFKRTSLFEGKGTLHWQKTLHCQMLTDSQDNVVGMDAHNLKDSFHWNLLGKAPGALLVNTTFGPHHTKDMQSGKDNLAAITPCSNISVATTLPGMAQDHQSPPPWTAAICPWFNTMSPGQDIMCPSSTPTHSSRTNSTGLSANDGAAQQHLWDVPPYVPLPPASLGLDARSRRHMPTKSSPTPPQDIVMTTGNADTSLLTETVQSCVPRRSGSRWLRCRNCGTRKTPQWRCGPAGPRTLCNACGVCFKKGLPLFDRMFRNKSGAARKQAAAAAARRAAMAGAVSNAVGTSADNEGEMSGGHLDETTTVTGRQQNLLEMRHHTVHR